MSSNLIARSNWVLQQQKVYKGRLRATFCVFVLLRDEVVVAPHMQRCGELGLSLSLSLSPQVWLVMGQMYLCQPLDDAARLRRPSLPLFC